MSRRSESAGIPTQCTHAHTRARAHTHTVPRNTHNSFGQLRATDWPELQGRRRKT